MSCLPLLPTRVDDCTKLASPFPPIEVKVIDHSVERLGSGGTVVLVHCVQLAG
jgi:hypothetical protein